MSTTQLDARQAVNSWLKQINPQDPGLLLDVNGLCQLVSNTVANNCIVFVPTSDSKTFYFFQDLCRIPEQLDSAAYEELLALNLLGIETRGGMLGFDKPTRNLVFSYSCEIAALDVKMFCTVLENFLDAAEPLRERVAGMFLTDVKKNFPKPAQRFLGK